MPCGRHIIWNPLGHIIFKLFRLTTGLPNIFEDACPNCESFFFRRYLLASGNLSFPAPHLPLSLWHFSAPYTWLPVRLPGLPASLTGSGLNYMWSSWNKNGYLDSFKSLVFVTEKRYPMLNVTLSFKHSPGSFHLATVNPLAPNDVYISRTAQLTSRRCILNIYSTNILNEYLNLLVTDFFFKF